MLDKKDLIAIGQVVDQKLDKRIKPLEKRIIFIEKDVKYIRESVGQIVRTFDKEYLELRNRVEKLENHLGIPQN